MTLYASTTLGPDSSRKTTLFCPECGHASSSDGDWIVRERAGRAEYNCPDCETAITTRSQRELPQYA